VKIPTLVVVVLVALSGCKSDADGKYDRWRAYSEKIAKSGVLEPAWEKFDRALAKGDAAGLSDVMTKTIYDVTLSDYQLHTHSSTEAIKLELDAHARCGVVGKTERLYEIKLIFGAVGLKNATFEQMGEMENRETVLPDEGMWIFLKPQPGIESAMNQCGAQKGIAVAVLAPVKGEWRVIGLDFVRPSIEEKPTTPSP
jgi:hypothetical protein